MICIIFADTFVYACCFIVRHMFIFVISKGIKMNSIKKETTPHTNLKLMTLAIFSVLAGLAHADESGTKLDTVVVEGKKPIGQIKGGKDGVYDDNLSSSFKDKQDIDTYRGTSVADVLQGITGVYSGDARNSGAIDPNVRGIQGQGRVPVTVDGTEQAITVYRGYAGANNRNYIDPLLISSIRVEKGPSLTRGMSNSVGGGIAIQTLGVKDVLKPGQKWGVDIRFEGANNATGDRAPNLGQWVGKTPAEYGKWAYPYMSKKDQGGKGVHPKYYDLFTSVKPEQQKFSSFGHDQAYRIAGAITTDRVDVVAALAHRNRGNYFAGKGGYERYQKTGFRHTITSLYGKGDEVTNTSNEMTSFLLKTTIRPTDNQSIGLGYHHIHSKYGDIMPSRIQRGSWNDGVNSFQNLYRDGASTVPQWPLSRISIDAYNLEYKFKPNNRWLNIDANIWATRAKSDTQNSGEYVLEPLNGLLANTALLRNSNNRWGINASNKMSITDTLNLTVSGSYQHETLSSRDSDAWLYGTSNETPKTPRQGKRDEYKLDFNFDWQPTEKLVISAGARYNSYSLTDDSWNKMMEQIPSLKALADNDPSIPYNAKNYALTSLQGVSGFYLPYIDKNGDQQDYPIYYNQYGKLSRAQNPFLNGTAKKEGWTIPDFYKTNKLGVIPGSINAIMGGTVLTDYMGLRQSLQLGFTKESLDAYNKWLNSYQQWTTAGMPGGFANMPPMPNMVPLTPDDMAKMTARMNELNNSDWKKQMMEKEKGHEWSPMVSIAYQFNDSSRVYARYAQATRMPSLFESAVGFSGTTKLLKKSSFKPEKATNIEVGYVQDIRKWLPENTEKADIKLSWYRNHIKNAFDRKNIFLFTQRDSWKTSGIELQARYDNGRFFTELGANYVMNNEVCDEDEALTIDAYGRIGNCVKGGFPTSFMSNMNPPKYTIDWQVGGRFFNQKLETGARFHYHSAWRQSEAKKLVSDFDFETFNKPLDWHSAVIIDAYVRYHFKNNLNIELIGSNLTNRYYLDPFARSPMPAPGRTIKLGLSKKF